MQYPGPAATRRRCPGSPCAALSRRARGGSEAVAPGPDSSPRCAPMAPERPLQARGALFRHAPPRVPTPPTGALPHRQRKRTQAAQAHGERQTSAELELKRRPEDVACSRHNRCLDEFDEPTRLLRRRQAFVSISLKLSRCSHSPARPTLAPTSPPRPRERRPRLSAVEHGPSGHSSRTRGLTRQK